MTEMTSAEKETRKSIVNNKVKSIEEPKLFKKIKNKIRIESPQISALKQEFKDLTDEWNDIRDRLKSINQFFNDRTIEISQRQREINKELKLIVKEKRNELFPKGTK